MWLGKIIIPAGVFATLFGFVYGSDRFEHLLPYESFKVLEGNNTNTILLLSVMIVSVLIITAMILNMVNGARQKNYVKLLFSPNGAAGLVLYTAILGAVLPMLGVVDYSISVPYILFLIVLPLILIFLREPLGRLLEGRPEWKPKSIGGYAVEKLFELVEIILSYVTNTISFLPVGAFALSHAGMMTVVFLLAETRFL
jgi:V/A-type H+-transporting ATPase subunit I